MFINQILAKLKSLVYLKSETDSLLNGYVPKAGGAVITGTTFNRTINDSSVTWCGGTDWDGGASITLSGKDRTNDNGDVIIRTKDNSNVSDLILRPNGTATWGNREIDTIKELGDGYIRYSSGMQICWGEHLGVTSENTVDINFPKAFKREYGVSISVCGQTSSVHPFGWDGTWVGVGNTANAGSFTYTAIGRWK